MNTRLALIALVSLLPATVLAAEKSPKARKKTSVVAIQASTTDATAPTGIAIPTHVQLANLDGSTGFPVITAHDWAVFQDAAFQGLPAANCDGSMEKPTVINILDYQCFMDRMARAYAWQQSVANTLAQTH